MELSNNVPTAGPEALKKFQLIASAEGKKSYDWGLAIARYISTTTFASVGNGYFWIRNTRFKQNRDMAAGKTISKKFMDMLEMNGKTNYINMNWQAIKIVNTIISKMVGRWMGRNEKIGVTATDSLSIKDKEDNYRQAEFVMTHREQLQQLQQESGVQMISPDQFVPADKDELDLWMAEYARLPEEILYEKGTNDVIASNGFFGENKEKILHDSAEVGLVVTYTWMDEGGVIHIDWVRPENYFYSYSEYNDMHDTSWRGDVVGMKISEIRKRWGVEFGGKLTEEDIWQLAQNAKEYMLYDKLRWLVEWNVAILRPYDEWNLDVIRFQLKTIDSDPYTLVKTKKNGSNIFKNGKASKLDDNEEFVEDKRESIYEGYYVRVPEKMLYWGLKENMIRPNDPKEIGAAMFSYSSYMYQNQDMRNVAVPEKIQEPAEQMILARYKIQQCVMKMKPLGAAVNWDALQEIDYGLGDKNKTIDPKRHWEQTGDIYYRGRDAEGNPIPIPITELTNSGFLQQMQGLIQIYQFHYQVLKDELGEDPSMVTAAAKPRVTEGNVQTSLQAADEATDYMYDAYLYVMEETAKRVSCLLHTSVDFGAQAYRHMMKEEDIKGRHFSTKIEMLPTEAEMQYLVAFLNQSLASNPQLIMFLDPAKMMRIAKENVKLAEWYMRNSMKKMWQALDQQKQQDQQANIQSQRQTAQDAIQGQAQLEQLKAQYEQSKTADLSRADKEKILLQGFVNMWATPGLVIAPELKGVEAEVIKNVVMPLFAENQTNQAALQQAMQMHQQADQQDQQNQPVDQSQQQIPQQTDQSQQQPQAA
jgi:hypothetical protein